MGARDPEFDWQIDERRDWPPPGYPRPPVSPSLLERLRACRLRACFEASPRARYPRRLLPAARLGIAFHEAMRDLEETPPAPDEAISGYCRRMLTAFDDRLARQRAEQAAEPREQMLAWPAARENDMRKALIRRVRSAWLESAELPAAQRRVAAEGATALTEQQLRSADGLVEGTPDRVERIGGRWRIVDYKTSLEPDEARDTRQVQLYSALWQELQGEWPAAALLVYELQGRTTTVPADPEPCRALIEEARSEARKLLTPRPPDAALANPGEVCAWCQFRPWCSPFWEYQAQATASDGVLTAGGAGLEGRVRQTSREASVVLLEIGFAAGASRARLRVRLPVERYPQAGAIRSGDWVRLLDTRITGAAAEPTAELLDRTELYRVVPEKPRW